MSVENLNNIVAQAAIQMDDIALKKELDYLMSEYIKIKNERDEAIERLRSGKKPVTADDYFKNFHRLLCERFEYLHDEDYWWRDQASLIEHIANYKKGPQ